MTQLTYMLEPMLDELKLIKTAGMPFLEQDRPKKVKEIYSALKRDHPDMPAEMKARIAARQGKKGKQKQGPPYKGPIKKWKEKEAKWEPPSKAELKQLLKDVGIWTAGLGLGTGAGYAIRKKILPHVLKNVGPKSSTAIGLGVGALGGLTAGEFFRQHQKRMDDAKKRDS